jgi:hypothetical protein
MLPTQKNAWLAQVQLLKESLVGLDGLLLLEFSTIFEPPSNGSWTMRGEVSGTV